MTSSRHGPDGLGYTRATMAITMGGKNVKFELILKNCLSSDYFLQLENMKLESLVIADQNAAVNMYPSLVHTARHALGIVSVRKKLFNQ